ncbi:patatin-like phospholipase family protein [Hydrogenophaga sp. 5NK40-0174]|uniref:patatin-like phospholipase family protein n=1 Tax=Hydrogenophaga sp. 5NK40-0174 TaxID=3127649 RepID=UPI00310B41B7
MATSKNPHSRTRRTTGSRRSDKHQLDLALQGGGSHGAFTWGVLERLLDEEWLEIAGISGTSAGAMNAVTMAAGLMEDGRDGAKRKLEQFWTSVATKSPFDMSTMSHPAWEAALPWWNAWMTPLQQYMSFVGSHLSPYQFNPLNLNPLRKILEDTVNFEWVRSCDKSSLYIAATHVTTGELKVFKQSELTVDMVLASACLPMLFQAVEVEGQAYWDGGYAGNPTLLPLVAKTRADDLLLVQINPTERIELPTKAMDIMDRTDEVTFNTSLLKELKALALVKTLIGHSGCPKGRSDEAEFYQRVDRLRLHRLTGDEALTHLGASTKLKTDWPFISGLRQAGREAATHWLEAHAKDLGKRSSYALPDVMAAIREA